jgi:hypothetical protein
MMAHQVRTISFGIIVVILLGQSDALLRRCFSCRSRGDLGDCRDPFLLSNGVQGNATTVGAIEGKKDGIDQPPCSSGRKGYSVEAAYCVHIGPDKVITLNEC